MKPANGYGKAQDTEGAKGAPTQVFSIWKNRSFVIESLWYYGNVLWSGTLQKAQMWYHVSEKAVGRAAGLPVVICRDGYDCTVDLIAEMAVVFGAERFNRNPLVTDKVPVQMLDEKTGVQKFDKDGNPQYYLNDKGEQILVERTDNDGVPYRITSNSDFNRRRKIMESMYPKGIDIPTYVLYDPAAIYRYTPKYRDSLLFGQTIVDDAFEMMQERNPNPPSFLAQNAVFLLCLLAGIVMVGFCYMAFK
jgi:hypothetical protein